MGLCEMLGGKVCALDLGLGSSFFVMIPMVPARPTLLDSFLKLKVKGFSNERES